MLEEQKAKLEHQKELKSLTLQSQIEIRQAEQGLVDLERKVVQSGQPLRLDLDGITQRVGAALDEAIKLIRTQKYGAQGGREWGGITAGAISSSSGGGGPVGGSGGTSSAVGGSVGGSLPAAAGAASSVSSLLEPGLSLEELLHRLTSPGWMQGYDIPRNTETLQVALQARNSLLELQRVHQAKTMQMVRGKEEGESAEEGNPHQVTWVRALKTNGKEDSIIHTV